MGPQRYGPISLLIRSFELTDQALHFSDLSALRLDDVVGERAHPRI